jgi:hypothetical protein
VAADGGLVAVTERVSALIKQRRPGIGAIDSFKVMGRGARARAARV